MKWEYQARPYHDRARMVEEIFPLQRLYPRYREERF
jgi:hypothetical protein